MVLVGAGDYSCLDRQFWFIDGGPGNDWFVSAPQSDESDQTWWRVLSGDIQKRVARAASLRPSVMGA